MDPNKLAKAARPRNLGNYVARLSMVMHHPAARKGAVETLRQEEHNGHQIVVRTTYRIEVDGKTLRVPLGVDNDGQVHCHSLPNYQTASAVDMVKALIDNFPDDFAVQQPASKRTRSHAGHGKTKPKKKGK